MSVIDPKVTINKIDLTIEQIAVLRAVMQTMIGNMEIVLQKGGPTAMAVTLTRMREINTLLCNGGGD